MCVYISLSIYIYIYICIHIYIYMYIHSVLHPEAPCGARRRGNVEERQRGEDEAELLVYVCIYIYMCMYVCMYIYIYIYSAAGTYPCR